MFVGWYTREIDGNSYFERGRGTAEKKDVICTYVRRSNAFGNYKFNFLKEDLGEI